ncbi:MAG: hypothetical protein K1X53_07975 [Candidatus Sumerlaeaceae bacterium]|nr:hypothetical protein [Candidatus Sumerlaeaceae bacterium]
MRGSIIRTLILWIFFLGFFGYAVSIQHEELKKVRSNQPFEDNLRLPSSEVLKLTALRYDMVAADLLWIRSIQSFGGRGMTNRDWRPVYDLFDKITDLDPGFEQCYTFGNMVIGDEGGRQKEGLGLINKGMFQFSLLRQYRIPFEGMYVANWQMKDVDKARWYGRIARKRADSPDWVPRIVAYLEVQSGAYYIGFDRFLNNFLLAVDANDIGLQSIALNKLKESVDKWNKSLLNKALDEYTSSTGRLPSRIEDLATMPALKNYEVAEISRLVALCERYLQKLSRPELSDDILTSITLPTQAQMNAPIEDTTNTRNMLGLQNLIFRQCLVKRSGIPEEPNGSHYVLNGTLLGTKPTDERLEVIASENGVREYLQNLLYAFRATIDKRKKELGRTPESLREVFYCDPVTTEPFGGKFQYDPKTGNLRSTSAPDL